jgi:hypothetical protein
VDGLARPWIRRSSPVSLSIQSSWGGTLTWTLFARIARYPMVLIGSDVVSSRRAVSQYVEGGTSVILVPSATLASVWECNIDTPMADGKIHLIYAVATMYKDRRIVPQGANLINMPHKNAEPLLSQNSHAGVAQLASSRPSPPRWRTWVTLPLQRSSFPSRLLWRRKLPWLIWLGFSWVLRKLPRPLSLD